MTVRTPPFQHYKVPTVGTRTPKYFVLHTTEGDMTIQARALFFRTQTINGKPANYGVNFILSKDAKIGRLMGPLQQETQHVAAHNSACIGMEQEGFTAFSRLRWLTTRRRQIYMAAWTLAWACEQLHIPLVAAGSEKGGRRFLAPSGVTQHRWVPDNDHDDCGTGYPFEKVLSLAQRWQKTGGPSKTTRLFIAGRGPKP